MFHINPITSTRWGRIEKEFILIWIMSLESNLIRSNSKIKNMELATKKKTDGWMSLPQIINTNPNLIIIIKNICKTKTSLCKEILLLIPDKPINLPTTTKKMLTLPLLANMISIFPPIATPIKITNKQTTMIKLLKRFTKTLTNFKPPMESGGKIEGMLSIHPSTSKINKELDSHKTNYSHFQSKKTICKENPRMLKDKRWVYNST